MWPKGITAWGLFVLALIVCEAGVAADIKGWRETQWGMTEKEVRKAVKGAQAEPNPSESHGLYYPLYLTDLDIEGTKFTATFGFDIATKRLTRVLLSAGADDLPLVAGYVMAEPVYKRVKDALERRYGAPTSNNRTSSKWILDSTVIEATYTDDLARNWYYVTIIYSTRSGEGDNL